MRVRRTDAKDSSENLTIETFRRLFVSLGIDMNTLDATRRRKEALSRAKGISVDKLFARPIPDLAW